MTVKIIRDHKSSTGETPIERRAIWMKANKRSEKTKSPRHTSDAHLNDVKSVMRSVDKLVGHYKRYVNYRDFGTAVKFCVPYRNSVGLVDSMSRVIPDFANVVIVESETGIVLRVLF